MLPLSANEGGQTRNVLQNLKTKVSNSAGDILIKCAMKGMEHLALLTFEAKVSTRNLGFKMPDMHI